MILVRRGRLIRQNAFRSNRDGNVKTYLTGAGGSNGTPACPGLLDSRRPLW